MQVTLFDIFNTASSMTIDKLVNAKMKDPKAVFSVVKLARKVEQERKNLDDTVAKIRDEWDEFPALKERAEELQSKVGTDPLAEGEVREELTAINQKINKYIGDAIEGLTKENTIELGISPIKIEALMDVGLSNAEIASVDWLIDFGGEVEE